MAIHPPIPPYLGRSAHPNVIPNGASRRLFLPRILRDDLCASERRSRGESLFILPVLFSNFDFPISVSRVAQGRSSGLTFGYLSGRCRILSPLGCGTGLTD